MTLQEKRHIRLVLSIFLPVLVVYLLTRAPGLTWEHRGADGGDFLAAAANLGIPHPAGYPTFTLLLNLMMRLPFREPAAAGNTLSVLMGAIAVAFTGGVIYQMLDRLARRWEERRWVPWAAAGGALTFAFTPLVWSQALITEIYAFHLALVSITLWLVLRWRRTGRGLPWVGLTIGLGLTNHLTIVFLGPAVLAVLVAGRDKLKWRSVLASAGAVLVGLSPYAYLPWAARRLPPINWENPQTWENFKRLVLASRYSQNLFEPSPADVIARVAGWIDQFSPLAFWPVYLLFLVGLLWLLRRDPPIGVLTGIYAVLSAGYALGYGTSDYWVNLLPALMMLAIWLATGLWRGLCWLGKKWEPTVLAALVVTLILPAVILVVEWEAMDIHQDERAMRFVDGLLETAAPEALIFTKGDLQTFGVWYACYVRDERPDLIPILPTFLRSIWYRETLDANHPGLDLRSAGLGQTALQTMIERHLSERTIYLTWEDEEIGADYWLIKEGPIWRVEEPAAGDLP